MKEGKNSEKQGEREKEKIDKNCNTEKSP